jgi:hypothetical protein
MALLLFACLLTAQDPAVDKKVASLIQRLASDDLDERERAQGELNSLGPSIKARLEAALPGASAEVAARLRAVLDNFAWEDMFKGALPPVARLTLERKKRTLEEILALVRGKTGWTFRASAMNLREPVDLGWSDAPALQVLDDACRALRRGRVQAPVIAGSDDSYDPIDSGDDRRLIAIDGDSSASPAVGYWNQFRVELRRITIVEKRGYSSTETDASLALVLTAQPGVTVLQAGNWIVDEITDDRGRSLKTEAKRHPWNKSDPEAGDARNSVWFVDDDRWNERGSNVEFEAPGPEAAKIARLKGRIRVTLAGRKVVETKKVADLREGGEIRFGETVVTISKAEMKDRNFSVTYSVSGKHHGHPSMDPVDADGRLVRTSGGGSSSGGSTWEQNWHVQGEVAALRISAILGHRTIEVPIELKELPLPKGD